MRTAIKQQTTKKMRTVTSEKHASIFPSLPGSRLTIFYPDASSALLQLVNQWLNFTYSRSHAFRYERKNTNPTLVRIELTISALAGVQVTLLDHSEDECRDWLPIARSPQPCIQLPLLEKQKMHCTESPRDHKTEAPWRRSNKLINLAHR